MKLEIIAVYENLDDYIFKMEKTMQIINHYGIDMPFSLTGSKLVSGHHLICLTENQSQ